jgi:lipopolysaccharide transport system permease protein
MLELLLQFTFYLTPIIYRPHNLLSNSQLSWVVDCNPLWSMMQLIREPILNGAAPPLYNVAVSVVFVGTLACVALWSLKKLERSLVFWI